MESMSDRSLDDVEEHNVCHEGDNLTTSNKSYEQTMFDIVIGHIEDIIVDDEFQLIQRAFMDRYWMQFENSEENKLIYTDIFKEYISVIEDYIERHLQARIPEFSMSNFLNELIEKKDVLEGEVFEVLFTFSDFSAFKQLFLDYKAMKEGTAVDFSSAVTITRIHLEED